ncbi:putative serine/threonine-protein kinase WNK4 [Camellia lanceoleosa]|uniref:Serine/threonine-protein kinase WNK4 n=1 Tax=Camellia lanceoleosa TaxID=1840588 RepID=A0ACC0IGL8_9ERIC|nr:putative serine/threonine-protein kinase WNK4 [Camellia lanceoleosa]
MEWRSLWNKVTVDDSFQSEEHMHRLNTLLKPLKHNNIIKSCSYWVDHQTKTINMISESFTSGSLRHFREKHRNVDIIAIKNWARQILQGLCYLHTRDPPIVHGDLTCQNIFVNGNTGQVKIGYIGLPTIMSQPPELHEKQIEYSPAVDVHSFGLCMLELVTSEYPYSYSDGKTQALLAKVKDTQVKQFIEKCLLSVSTMDLLKDPFFEIPTFTTCINDTPDLVSVLEFKISNKKSEFRLRGERADGNSISLTLRIADKCSGQVTKIEFVFNLDADMTLAIAWEMVEQLELPKEDVSLIAELMDNVIMKMVPCWMPSSVRFSGVKFSYGDPILVS